MTMNSYLITNSGVSLLINSKPFSVNREHPNFDVIMQDIRNKNFAVIPAKINKLVEVKEHLDNMPNVPSDVVVDVEGGVVTCQGTEIPSSLSSRIVRMFREGFDIGPMTHFISNLFNNPSNRTISELYTFLEYGGLPITEDGCFVAYKKIRADWTDCHTMTVLNKPVSAMTAEEVAELQNHPRKAGQCTTRIGSSGETEVSMPRRAVDDRSENTCSAGLHFCSFDYLQSFGGARVVVVKINPADVVSIPVDYNNTKGRTCRYEVISECTDNVESVTEKSVYTAPAAKAETPVVPADNNDELPPLFDTLTVSEEEWYLRGYTNGRNKAPKSIVPARYYNDYEIGYKHGRGKQRKLYPSNIV